MGSVLLPIFFMHHKKFSLILIVSKITLDYLVILASFIFAYVIRINIDVNKGGELLSFSEKFPLLVSTDFSFAEYFLPIVFIAILWIVVMYYARCYRLGQQVNTLRYFERIVFVVLVGVAAYAIAFFFLERFIFSRLIFVFLLLLSSGFLYLGHYLHSLVAKHFYKKGVGTYKTLIIGTNREAKKLIAHLKDESSIHEPVAILDGYGSKDKEIMGVPVLGKLNKLEDTVEKYSIEQIIQADNLEQTINLINFSLNHNLKYAMLPSLLGVYKKGYKLEMEGMDMIRVE